MAGDTYAFHLRLKRFSVASGFRFGLNARRSFEAPG